MSTGNRLRRELWDAALLALDDPPDPPHASAPTAADRTRAARWLLGLTADELLVVDQLTRSALSGSRAMWRRWRERGHDPIATCRAVIDSDAPLRDRARAFLALAEAGHPMDRATAFRLIDSGERPLQRVALRALSTAATADDARRLLALLTDPTLAADAARALAAQPWLWSVADVDPFAASPDSHVRRRAWQLCRRRRGWDALAADLRAAGDREPSLAAAARSALADWLRGPANTLYARPTADQARRIGEAIGPARLPRRLLDAVAFVWPTA